MTNSEIAKTFKTLADLMDIHGENRFKSKAFQTAAYNIERIPQPLASHDLKNNPIPGIGSTISESINELLTTGALAALDNYLANTPTGILDLLQLKGLGPRKIGQLWKELHIESIGELAKACEDGRLLLLKGFGEKTRQQLADAIVFFRSHEGHLLFAEAIPIAAEIKDEIRTRYPNSKIEATGDFRRQMPVLDTLSFVTDLSVDLLKGIFPSDHIEEVGKKLTLKTGYPIEIGFYLSQGNGFNETLFRTTNTTEFNAAFDEKFEVAPKPVSESAIFEQNGLQFIHPALRETRTHLEKFGVPSHEKPVELIEKKDIKGIIHSHSTYSDGRDSLEDMALAAKQRGYQYLVISDHSQAAAYASGLRPETVRVQHKEIDVLNKKLFPFRIFKGIEADILSQGDLDYGEDVLKSFELVIASIHSNLKMDRERATMRLLKAIHNPFTTILGHPTGRLLLRREGYPIDHKAVIDACAAQNVAIEINANPKRLDLDWEWIMYALEKGVMLSINPDAHSTSEIDLVGYGVFAAQKGGLTKEKNLSSKPLDEFISYLDSVKFKLE